MRTKLKIMINVLITSQFIFSFFLLLPAFAEQKAVLKGRILDMEGKALKGASVFIYDSSETKRAVDLVSAQTGEDGFFRVALPSGRFWAIARIKAGGRYGLGPLMPGDKFSGEPMEIELAPGEERVVDFVVMDIMEFSRQKKKISSDYIRIKGRITDEKGQPVRMAYAFANMQEKSPKIPDYLSAWTDDEGQYTLYLPRGEYYVGYATAFPPDENYMTDRTVVAETDKAEIDIVIKTEGTVNAQ